MLTARQERFALEYLVDRNGTQAAVRSGYAAKSARSLAARLLRNPEIRDLIDQGARETAAKLQVTREKAVRGLLQGVEIARAQGNAAGVMRGWVEIAKLLGLYAPEPKSIEVSGAGSPRFRDLETLSDEELLGLVEAGG